MGKLAIIFHGLGGNDQENWFPWLRRELEALGWTVWIPQMPNPSHPNWQAWREAFLSFIEEQSDHAEPHEVTWIGHSLGVPFSLRLIQEDSGKLANLLPRHFIGVSGFVGPIEHEYDARVADISHFELKPELCRARCPKFTVFHGDDDPYVPLKHAKALEAALEAKLTIIEGGGHLNGSGGYTEFSELLNYL